MMGPSVAPLCITVQYLRREGHLHHREDSSMLARPEDVQVGYIFKEADYWVCIGWVWVPSLQAP